MFMPPLLMYSRRVSLTFFFLFYTYKTNEHDISAYQSYPFLLYNCVAVIADRSREWQPNSRQPPPGKCFSGNSGCVWGGYTRSEHWLAGSRHPPYELCSLCQWLLLECNSFVSKGWCAGQSSKVESLRLGSDRGAAPSAPSAECASEKATSRPRTLGIPRARRFHDPPSPVCSCSLFSIVADESQREVSKQLMADILSVFWQTVKEREINLSVSNLFLPTAAVGFGRPVLFAVAPGTVI